MKASEFCKIENKKLTLTVVLFKALNFFLLLVCKMDWQLTSEH